MAGSDLVPLYYLASIGVAVGGGVAGVRSYLGRQREKWLDEGKKEASLAKELEQNSLGMKQNTEAIEGLSNEMRRVATDLREFTQESRRRFDSGDRRFQLIEDSIWGGRGNLPDRGVAGKPNHS